MSPAEYALRSRCAASLLSSLHPALLSATVVRPCGITVTPLSRQRDISVNISANSPRIYYPGRAGARRLHLGTPRPGGIRRSVGEGLRVPAVEHLPHPARSRGHVNVAQSGAMVERIDDGIDHRRRGADGAGLARALDAERI